MLISNLLRRVLLGSFFENAKSGGGMKIFMASGTGITDGYQMIFPVGKLIQILPMDGISNAVKSV